MFSTMYVAGWMIMCDEKHKYGKLSSEIGKCYDIAFKRSTNKQKLEHPPIQLSS